MADPTLGDYAASAGALFTAIAATAALWTARQGRAIIEAAELPQVEVQSLRGPGGNLLLTIINTGQATARGVNFTAYAMGQTAHNVVDDGFLRSDESARVTTHIGPLPKAADVIGVFPDLAVVVAYRDARGFVHYRTHREQEYVPRTLIRRRPKYPDHDAVWKRLFPKAPIDTAAEVSSVAERL